MGEIIEYEVGCRKCINLVRSDSGTFMCIDRVHLDDSPVIPIKNGIRTYDWGACSGEGYVRDRM